MDRQKMMDRLGAIRMMLEHWPDMSADTKAWMIAERDKLIGAIDEPHPDAEHAPQRASDFI